MLRGRGELRRGVGRQASSPDAGQQQSRLEPRQRRQPTESTLRAQGPRRPRDHLWHLLSDGKMHSAREIASHEALRDGAWYRAVHELAELGYVFRRRDNSLMMEKRRAGEPRQDLGVLLAGIDATREEDLYGRRAEADVTPARSAELEPGWEEAEGEADQPDFMDGGGSSPEPGEGALVVGDGEAGFWVSGPQYVTSTRAILARKRSGKTYLGLVLAEELARHRYPFVVIDPTGVWHGLRSLEDGSSSGLDILHLGGKHGQLDLGEDDGAAVASMVAGDRPPAVILDLSSMDPAAQHVFVAAFGERLYAECEAPVHVFVDEADEFAPQAPDSLYPDQRRCLRVMDRLVRRGGQRGVGTTLITQRPAVVNKNLLSQIDGFWLLCLSAPQDLTQVEAWLIPLVQAQSSRAACLRALPGLQPGEAFCVLSQGDPITRIRVRRRRTWDSSRTPKIGEPPRERPMLGLASSEVERAALTRLGRLVEEQSPAAVGGDGGGGDDDDELEFPGGGP